MVPHLCSMHIVVGFLLVHGVKANACKDLDFCSSQIEFGPNGSWSYVNLEEVPESEAGWTKVITDICSTKEERIQCALSSKIAMCKNQTVLILLELAKRVTGLMCGTDGRKFFQRLYYEEAHCLAAKNKVAARFENFADCRQRYHNKISEGMSEEEKCRLVNQTRTCDTEFLVKMCGNLFQWAFDRGWKARIEITFPNCVNSLSPFLDLPRQVQKDDNEPSPISQEQGCQDMEACVYRMERGEDGSLFFMELDRFPSSEEDWTSMYINMCRTKEQRKQCALYSTCKNKTILEEAHFQRKVADFMCESDGIKFLEKLYRKELRCLGSKTKLEEWKDDLEKCKRDYQYTITKDMDKIQKCMLVNETRHCDAAFLVARCGNTYRWLVDSSWRARIEASFPECLISLYPLTEEDQEDKNRSMPESHESAECQALRDCMEVMERGTWSFLYLTKLPTEEKWKKLYTNICTTRQQRTQCVLDLHRKCNNNTLVNMALLRKKVADFFCEPNGLDFFPRLYREETHCVGNKTKVELQGKHNAWCKNQYPMIVKSEDPMDTCRSYNKTRTCDVNFVTSLCGNLYRWLVDNTWRLRIEVFAPYCVRHENSTSLSLLSDSKSSFQLNYSSPFMEFPAPVSGAVNSVAPVGVLSIVTFHTVSSLIGHRLN